MRGEEEQKFVVEEGADRYRFTFSRQALGFVSGDG